MLGGVVFCAYKITISTAVLFLTPPSPVVIMSSSHGVRSQWYGGDIDEKRFLNGSVVVYVSETAAT